MLRAGITVLLLIVSACAGSSDRAQQLSDDIVTPVDDLNVTRKEIPQTLKQLDAVYTAQAPDNCAVIAEEIAALSEVLGPDRDAPDGPDESDADKAKDAASDAAVDAVSDVATGWLPFRGVVRRISGASAYEKRAKDAVLKGMLRRAYLKGAGQAAGCEYPAAPRPPEQEEPVTE